MKDENITRVRFDQLHTLKDETDVKRLREMTDEEVLQAALDDPDAQPLEVRKPGDLKPIVRPQWTRRRLGMSQQEFADIFGFSVRSLQEWEQGRSQPGKTIRAYLRVIAVDPEAVMKALKREKTA